jgi:hypothetical protein
MRSLPAQDLEERLRLGLARGGALCTDEELAVVERLLVLDDDEALVLARLTGRKGSVFRVPELSVAGLEGPVEPVVQRLIAAGALTAQVPWSVRLQAASRVVLAEGARRLGLPVSGRRAELAARLEGVEGWDEAPWVGVAVDALVLRLERWATLRPWPDRSVPVLERMGRVRWPVYAPTGGALVPDRACWLRWEGLVAGLDRLEVEQAWEALGWSHWPPGRLDLRRWLEQWLADRARELERSGAYTEAAQIYAGLLARDGTVGGWWVRRARCLELGGEPAESLAELRLGRESTRGAERIEVARAGRRVARALRVGWAPDPPLQGPRERDAGLARVGLEAGRPLYGTAQGPRRVEAAVEALITAAGRRVLPGEHGIWRLLVALCLAELAWMPVAGQLPVPHLSGPLDLWTAAFAPRRAEAVFERMEALRAGHGPAIVAAAWDRHHGERCFGVRWETCARHELVALADGLGPAALAGVVRVVLAQGRRAFAGLPDLVVLPGEPVRLEAVWPSLLPASLVLIEVKGEADGVRDAQQWWFDHFVRSGVAVELWRVRAPLADGAS